MFKKIVVGMSGGVDSAVTALLLKNKGYDVQGVFMKNWDIADEQGICTADEDFNDSLDICKTLGIPLKQVNFVKEYWNDVFSYLLNEYQSGNTPNPDVLCNRYIKFNYFYKYARDVLNADAVATGHYARSSFGNYLENYDSTKSVKLLQACDRFKDQTLFLSQIEQEALKRTMFPLGDLKKTEVKKIAMQSGLENIAKKKESVGICFIGTRNFKEFISEYIPDKPGDFVDIETGVVVGHHKGIHHWTVGQRSQLPGVYRGYYIAKKDPKTNTIYLAQGGKHSSLHSQLLFTGKPHWICERPIELQNKDLLICLFKFQHTHQPVICELFETDKGLIVKLYATLRALTPGQFAVFYKKDECLGSAKISYVGPTNYMLYWLKNNSDKDINITKMIYKYTDSRTSENSESNINIIEPIFVNKKIEIYRLFLLDLWFFSFFISQSSSLEDSELLSLYKSFFRFLPFFLCFLSFLDFFFPLS